jgi:hypothetical protein
MDGKGRHVASGSSAFIRDLVVMAVGIVIVGVLLYGGLSLIAGLGSNGGRGGGLDHGYREYGTTQPSTTATTALTTTTSVVETTTTTTSRFVHPLPSRYWCSTRLVGPESRGR